MITLKKKDVIIKTPANWILKSPNLCCTTLAAPCIDSFHTFLADIQKFIEKFHTALKKSMTAAIYMMVLYEGVDRP